MIHLKYPRNPHAIIIETGPDIQEVQHPTLQCVHCGIHWIHQPGEGKLKRGVCLKCMGPTCGCKKCNECNPYHK